MQPSKKVFSQGKVRLVLTAGQAVAVAALSACQVYQEVGYPNEPATLNLLGVVQTNNPALDKGETVFGPYASGAVIVLQAGQSGASYSVGISPRVMENAAAQLQGTPGVLNATGTLTAAMILAGLVTSTTAAAVAGTLDTGTVLDTNIDMMIGQSFDFSIIATGGNAFTLTSAASGTSIVGNAVVAAGKSGQFRCRKTAVATYIFYRLDGG